MNLVKARLICESLEGVLHSINPGQVQCVFLGQGGTFTTVFRTDRTMATCARLPTFCFDQSQQRMKMSSSPYTLFSPADSYYLDNWHRSDVVGDGCHLFNVNMRIKGLLNNTILTFGSNRLSAQKSFRNSRTS